MTTEPSAGSADEHHEIDWAAVANDALHYLAGGALLALVAFFYWYGKVSQDLFVLCVTGAAAAVGIKLKG